LIGPALRRLNGAALRAARSSAEYLAAFPLLRTEKKWAQGGPRAQGGPLERAAKRRGRGFPDSQDLADYLFVAVEPVVAGGGGIMFHVSARYFQFAPSCTMTLK
jgi:hypothetical protein